VKIAFITSCLEPGRDGVGDYTALLAAECARRGHATRLLSLNDPYAGSPAQNGDLLRVSSRIPWSERVKKGREFVAEFAPDFVSLQFVAYGFHPRGIDPALAKRLRAITGSRPVQIMFHELWIGAGKGAGMKDRLIGKMQRACVLRVVKALDTRVVHANTAAYTMLLKASGIAASTLPLFGSIPQPPGEMAARVGGETLVFGLFGTLHPVWPPEPLFSRLIRLGKKIVVAHIGRLGEAGEPLWKRLAGDYAGAIEFKRLGEQPPEKIAEFFRREIDFGIATTPWALIGKSATVASMLEHGLPVIVNRDDWNPEMKMDAGASSPLLIKMDDNLADRISSARRKEPASNLPAVATQFLGDLELAL